MFYHMQIKPRENPCLIVVKVSILLPFRLATILILYPNILCNKRKSMKHRNHRFGIGILSFAFWFSTLSFRGNSMCLLNHFIVDLPEGRYLVSSIDEYKVYISTNFRCHNWNYLSVHANKCIVSLTGELYVNKFNPYKLWAYFELCILFEKSSIVALLVCCVWHVYFPWYLLFFNIYFPPVPCSLNGGNGRNVSLTASRFYIKCMSRLEIPLK